MKPRTARFIAWSFVAVFFILVTIGLTLQILTNTSYTNIAFPVLLIVLPLIGVWPIIGALIISRHPNHPVGWLLSLGLMSSAFDMFFSGYASYDINMVAGTLPGIIVAHIWLKLSGFPFATTAFTLMFLVFPDGRPSSPVWRKLAWMAVGTLLFYIPIQAVEPGFVDPFTGVLINNPLEVSPSLWTILKPLWMVGLTMLAVCNLAAVISLILRLRGARGDERRQIKWLVVPAVVFFTSIPLTILGLVGTNAQALGIAIALAVPSIAGMVIASAFAIFMYRLYDIDLLINRALVYGSLTVLVIGIYVLVVGALGTFFQTQGNLLIALLATGIVAVLFQPLRERLQRGANRLIYGERDDPVEALSRLGSSLESVPDPQAVLPTLVVTIAETLKLPYVAILLPGEAGDQIAAAHGKSSSDGIRLPLIYQGKSIGHLVVEPRHPDKSFHPSEMRLLHNIARQAGAAVHAVQLNVDLQRSRQRLVTAREEERRRLRRDLHDGLGPTLAALHVQANALHRMIHIDPEAAEMMVVEFKSEIREAIDDIRRVVYELRPPTLDELGLVGAAQAYITQCSRQVSQGASRDPDDQDEGVPSIHMEAPPELPLLPAAVEVAAYHIIREALTNVVHHAQARHCFVSLVVTDELAVEIRDDGSGIKFRDKTGVGLMTMRERTEELGGSFIVESDQDRGTRVRACFPLVEA